MSQVLDFRPIRLSDGDTIRRYTFPSGTDNCDLAFANMYCWRFMYRSEWAVAGGFLQVKFRIGGGEKIGYMQPVGEGDFTPLVPLLERDAQAAGQRLRIAGLTDEGCRILRTSYEGEYAFYCDPDTRDYIYDAAALRSLAGSRYQSKRNHINRFASAYDYRYEPLTSDRLSECMRLEARWRRLHADDRTALTAEQTAMQTAFDDFEALGLSGGCLYAGERLVAFTYGSPVNESTFCIHVEKADTRYEGAYTMINKLFAESLPDRYVAVNREEDLGVEGLRRSKLSYHPARMGRKFAALKLDPDEAGCKRLWRECFHDDEGFIDNFIINYYRHEGMFCRRRDGRIVSMLHILPFDTPLGRTAYIYGVATAPAYRRLGLAAETVREALELTRRSGYDAAMLIPGGEELRAYYRRLGFDGNVGVGPLMHKDFDFGTGDPSRDRAMILPYCNPAPTPPENMLCRYVPGQNKRSKRRASVPIARKPM